MGNLEIFLAFFSLLFLFSYCFRNKNGVPTNWPLVGMLPALLKNHRRVHDFIVEALQKSSLTTFYFQGPIATKMNILLTVDPLNVHHVLRRNFGNYPKGSEFKKKFEIFGDGLLNSDSDIWLYHRKMAQLFLGRPSFHRFLVKKIWEKIESGLMPILDHVSKHGLEIDLQELFRRLTFDIICIVVVGHDPRALCIDLPDLPCFKALRDAEEAILYRHIQPTYLWKFQRWLGLGREKKHREAWNIIDDFLYECISKKREEMDQNSNPKPSKVDNEVDVDLISLYMDEVKKSPSSGTNSDKFLRDTLLAFIIAGLETTSVALSWFFYSVSKNPHVLSKVKEELDATMVQINSHHTTMRSNRIGAIICRETLYHLTNKLIYLHGAIYETFRLYPPVAFEAKVPVEPDTLPSGDSGFEYANFV